MKLENFLSGLLHPFEVRNNAVDCNIAAIGAIVPPRS
jgi:hypothetical protein